MVKNPSFEEYYHLPDTTYFQNIKNSAFQAKHWHKTWLLTPNYFHINSEYKAFSIPYNCFGYYPVLEGSAYIGAHLLSLQTNIAVHFAGEFIKPLEEGKEYEISFYYCFAHLESYFLLDKIEVCISSNNWLREIHDLPEYYYTYIVEPYDTNTFEFSTITANVTFQDSIINDGKWHKMTGCYKSKGGEEYIAFGIFYQNNDFSQAFHVYPDYNHSGGVTKRNLRRFYKYYKDTLFIHRNPLYSPQKPYDIVDPKEKDYFPTYQFAYYFFDNVSVVEIP
jgi:hypothetical protein